MHYLGRTGIKVSELCFGALTFGGRGRYKRIGDVGQKLADTLAGMAIDHGINFFDTADYYSQGLSEEILGKALGTRRNDVILATKVFGRMGPGENNIGLSRRHILEGCEASLRRLGTDYIDLYQVHCFDPYTALEESLRALDDLVRWGKARYIGCSNFAAWQLMKALSISERHGWERFTSIQALYSLISRDVENEIVPLCLDQGLALTAWSPLGGGYLSGKYRRGQPRPEGHRLSDPKAGFIPFSDERGFEIIDELDRISIAHNASIAQAALNYLLQKPGITSVIIGARDIEQLNDNLKSTEWEMTPAELARLDDLSKPAPSYPTWYFAQNQFDR